MTLPPAPGGSLSIFLDFLANLQGSRYKPDIRYRGILQLLLFDNLSFLTLLVIAVAAVATSSIHGATGVAGGFLMAAVLASVIGVKPVVPIMSVALLISHSSRTLLNLQNFHARAFFNVTLVAFPCLIVGSLVYGRMSTTHLALILGVVVLVSIPIRRWAKAREIKAGTKSLRGAAAAYGFMAGMSVGPGMLLIPFLLGFGLAREAFVATLAAIALVTNITRLGVYGATDLLDGRFIALGILVGLLTIPGNWLGRKFLRSMTNERHTILVDVLTVVGAANFFWLALR